MDDLCKQLVHDTKVPNTLGLQ